MSDTKNLTAEVGTALETVPKGYLGVAVSGGSDSVALLRLLRDWASKHGRNIYVATVNHNLRAEAQTEAEFVANLCKDLEVPHSILNWDNWDGRGNLQNAARNARKNLLVEWAQELDLTAVALGHTEDDQAETFLLRLARGSGVDGLSCMQKIAGKNPALVRPLLNVSRDSLRSYLSDLGQGWIEDPSNNDARFDRVKMRNAMPVLAELGLTSERLAATASRMQPARAALEQVTQEAAHECCEPTKFGTVTIDLKHLQSYPIDIQYRVLSYSMGWVSGAVYRPRFSALKSIYDLLKQGKPQTLAGCYIKIDTDKHLIVMREVASMATKVLENEYFDNRWLISANENLKGVDIRPLGEKGLRQLKDWRNLGVIRDILQQTPAAWQDDVVFSAPLAGFIGPIQISLKIDADQFFQNIVSH